MVRTFADIKADVQNLVIDLPPTVQAAVPRLVNDAIRSMQRRYNFRAMESQIFSVTSYLSQALAPNTSVYFKEYRDDGPYLYRFTSRSLSLATMQTTEYVKDVAVLGGNVSAAGMPKFLLNAEDASTGLFTFSIAPYADQNSDWSDGNYRVIIPIYVYSTPLINAGDSNWFTNNADDYIIYKATGEAFGLDWDNDSMAIWLQRAEEKFKEVKKADMKNLLSSVTTLVPMWRGANQPKVRT